MYLSYGTKAKIVLFIVMVLIVSLTSIRLWLLDQLELQGKDLTKLEHELDQVKQENARLRNEILEKSSFHYIYQKAKDQGFTEGIYFVLK